MENLLFLSYLLITSKVLAEKIVENPCTNERIYKLNYYQSHPLDETKYIKCNPWGIYKEKTCLHGFKWNSFLMSCVKIQNVSDAYIHKEDILFGIINKINHKIINQQTCNYYGNNTCLNDGICNILFSGHSKCLCLSNFSADYCQTKDPLSKGVFSNLINSTFSIDLYKKQRQLLNDTVDELNMSSTSRFRIELLLDPTLKWSTTGKQLLERYLALYKDGTIRFDTLINYLIEDYLIEIYPTAFYLHDFNSQPEIEIGLNVAIHNLLFSSKYYFDNFKKFMAIYDNILDSLVDYLIEKQPSIKDEARYFHDLISYMHKYGEPPALNVNSYKHLSTKSDLLGSISDDFNMTLAKSFEMFYHVHVFREELINNDMIDTREEILGVIRNFSLSSKIMRTTTEIYSINSEIWDLLSLYGFWYLLSSFVDVSENLISFLYLIYDTQA